MASQVPVNDNSNTKSEEGTMAFHKKRARRVSFAENTSVHIFDRDEDSGTPLDPKPPSSPSDELGSAERKFESGQLFWNVDEDDNDNNNEDDDMDEPGSRSPFLRFVGSPSSGGSTVGSANSNDEDNFFGPVSANFIRRDLLDSSASDANHDQTMDSTAFSMHFRSLARSDSEVELKTSTGVHLSFEEKTPTHDSVTTNTRTPMLMTLAKKQNHQPSISTSKLSTKSESNDMSIVGEYHHKYDYGELSPTFDALMADPSNISTLKSPRNLEATKENGTNLMDLSCDEGNHVEGHELVNEDAFQIKSNLDFSTQVNPSPKNTTYINNVIGKEHKSPFIDGVIPSKSPLYVTPSHNHSTVFVRTENQEHVLSIQSIQKSISKLRMLEASPFSAVLNAKLQDSITKSIIIPSKMTPLNTLLEKNNKSPLFTSIKDSGHLSSDVQKKRARESSTNMDDIRLETPNNVVPMTRMQNLVEISSPLLKSSTKIGYKDDKDTNGLPQSIGYSSQKRLKVVNTTEFKNSPLRIEKSGSLVSSEEEMVDVNSTILLKNEEHEKFQDKFMGSDIVIGEMKEASPVLHEGTDKQSCKKDQFCQSPSNKQPHNTLQDEDMMVDIIAKTHTSPKVNVHLETSSENEISTIVQKFKHPSEVNAIVSNEMKELLSQSVDKFKLHTIDRLSGIVDQLLMSKTYQLLSDEIQSQKSVDISKNLQHKRVPETKLLLCKFVHEKAKLQLMQVKRERLLKRVKSLASGISESEELKSKFPPKKLCESMSVNMKNLQESQTESEKVTSTRQTLDNVDQRIEKLTKSFHKSCKMKEELSSIDTITFVNNHLRKQACCQIIRKDMQLWVVDNLKNRNGCHSVDLNYLDLMTQRLTVNDGTVPSVSISHELNNVNISKNFKDMEACTAFRFVFNGEIQKHVGSINLAKETQVTGARFADQLDLELCFLDPKHHRKATLTLNTSCLKRHLTQPNSKEHLEPTPTSQHTPAENKEEVEKGSILIRVFNPATETRLLWSGLYGFKTWFH
ncbi:hypothetical protein L2E82_25582 [Cichorium intybus]|uniref:Uncharacterized protein n=1 Tax=Cichorium intybus TaxID=13427 RepID=A0ACB9E3Z1_CICIN|nr:hypothetical protein L2E82_25582 [Cichorium intybus]